MTHYLIFYANQLYGSVDRWRSSELPDGAYVYARATQFWYLVQHASTTPINLCDVPKELRLLAVLTQ